jgi:hypothetical protein
MFLLFLCTATDLCNNHALASILTVFGIVYTVEDADGDRKDGYFAR